MDDTGFTQKRGEDGMNERCAVVWVDVGGLGERQQVEGR